MIEFDVGLSEFGAELEHGKDGPELTGAVLLYLLMLYFPVLYICFSISRRMQCVVTKLQLPAFYLFIYLCTY